MEAAEPEPDPNSDWSGGPLGDCPEEHRDEVSDALQDLAERDRGDFGSFGELRQWLADLQRLGGFSKEAMLKYAAIITRCLTAEREPKALVTRESLQQAFVRMGGLKQTVHTMCLRIGDPQVVTACAKLLAAAVQGAPHAAEQVASAGSDLRLLLRAIERHSTTTKEVAEIGCSLICHLCSLTPYQPCFDPIPPRTKAHRDAQKRIAAEGALDVITGILGTSVREVKQLHDKIQGMEAVLIKEAQIHKENALAPAVVGKKREDHLRTDLKQKQESIQRVKNNVEVRQRWKQLAEIEVVESRIQSSALQALILLAIGNETTTRMLSGSLAAERAASVAEPAEEPAPHPSSLQVPRTQGPGSAASSRRPSKTRPSKLVRSDSGMSKLSHIPEERPAESTETLKATARAVGTLVDVLRNHNTGDRPEIASRACRLISMICEHHLALAKAVNDGSKARRRQLEAKFLMDLGPTPSKGLGAVAGARREAPVSFEPLRGGVEACTAVLRMHPDCVSLVSASIQALSDIRAVSLETAAAAGSGAGGGLTGETLNSWRKMLHMCEEKGEISHAARFLRDALYSTEVANSRIASHGIKPEDLVGEGVYLTPRAKADATTAKQQAAELSADCVAIEWRDGEPQRRERKADIRAKEQEAKLAAQLAAERQVLIDAGIDPDAVEPPASESASLTGDDAGSQAGGSAGSRRSSAASSPTGSRAGKGKGKGMEDIQEDEPQPLGGGWSRAMGYDAYETDELETVWRRPMEAAFNRSFSTPAVPPRYRKKNGRQVVPTAPVDPDALDRLLNLEFLESTPGRIRARLVVQPQDMCQQTTYFERLKELTDDDISAKVITSSMSKDLKKEGFLMPRYGMTVRIRKANKEDTRRLSLTHSASLPSLLPTSQ
mmetsp:Transcript_10727/g.37537  ORF Transcript_10727/g.37537 Transcript_10727/m.37537 type:complete len:892 (-) Transcript_10727:22-2697(-)